MMQTQRCLFVSHDWINKPLSQENEVPRTLSEDRKVAGSATYTQRDEIVLSFEVGLFIQFIQSWKQNVCIFQVL